MNQGRIPAECPERQEASLASVSFVSKNLHSFQLQMMIQLSWTETTESPEGINVGTNNVIYEVEAISNEVVTESRRPTSEHWNAAPSSNDERAAEHRTIVEDRRASSGAPRHRRIERLCNDSLSLFCYDELMINDDKL